MRRSLLISLDIHRFPLDTEKVHWDGTALYAALLQVVHWDFLHALTFILFTLITHVYYISNVLSMYSRHQRIWGMKLDEYKVIWMLKCPLHLPVKTERLLDTAVSCDFFRQLPYSALGEKLSLSSPRFSPWFYKEVHCIN